MQQENKSDKQKNNESWSYVVLFLAYSLVFVTGVGLLGGLYEFGSGT